nr:glycosyl transferase [Rubritepida sp.]
MNILFLCHGHPALQTGGTEIAAHALFRSLKAEGAQGLFVAGVSALHRPASPGTPFQAVGEAADEVLMRTEAFDRFFLSQTDLHGIGL